MSVPILVRSDADRETVIARTRANLVAAALAGEVNQLQVIELHMGGGEPAVAFIARFKGRPREAYVTVKASELTVDGSELDVVRRLRTSDLVENGTPEIGAEVERIAAAQAQEEASEAALQAERDAYRMAQKLAEYRPRDGDAELYDAAVLALVAKGDDVTIAVSVATKLVKGRRALMATLKK